MNVVNVDHLKMFFKCFKINMKVIYCCKDQEYVVPTPPKTMLSIFTGHDRGGSRNLRKGGHNILFFLGPPPASKLAQVPKKLISGTPTLFFRSAIYVGGGGGGEVATGV